MFYPNVQWSIFTSSTYAYQVFLMYNSGNVYTELVQYSCLTRPTVYLKPEVDLTGEGTSSNPYVIK